MEIVVKAPGTPARVGVLSSAFHPPTRAHLALAEAALAQVDEILFVLPRAFPHKEYDAVTLPQRLEILRAAISGEPRYSVGIADGGLFIQIARECRPIYGPAARLSFVCGRDAAERIVNWDYGEHGAFSAMLEEFDLLVAARRGTYEPPADLRRHIHELPLPRDLDELSASEVRDRIDRGEPWEELVPRSIVPLVRRYYRTPE